MENLPRWTAEGCAPAATSTTWPLCGTSFKAMGVVMWRDFHDRFYWIDIESTEFDTMIRYNQSWSGKEDEAKRDEVKRRFEGFWKFQHNAGFNFGNRDRACTHEAKVINSSCTFGDLENEGLSTTDIFMRRQIPMIQVMQKDQKLEEMQINFSPYLEVRKDKSRSADRDTTVSRRGRQPKR